MHKIVRFGLVVGMVVGSLTMVAAARATTLTAAISPKVIDVGQTTRVSGTLSSHASGTTVVIERSTGGGHWSKVASGRTTTGGKYGISYRVTVSGSLRYRARVGYVSSPSVYLKVRRTVNLDSFTSVTNYFYEGSVSVNGKAYARSLYDNVYCSMQYVEYDLGRKWQTLSTVVGVRDDSDSRARTTWRIYGDGRQLASGQTQLGQSSARSINVTGVLRLRFEYEGVQGACYTNRIVFGTPLLKG